MIGGQGSKIGRAEYARLTEAMRRHTPRCLNDSTFTVDDPEPDEITMMTRRCLSCPVALECRDYARAARPTVGFWAGRLWGTTPRKGEK